MEAVDIQVDFKADAVEITFADKDLNDCLILKMNVKEAQDLWSIIQEATNLTAQKKLI